MKARSPDELVALLLEKASAFSDDECWPWPGAHHDAGYGQMSVDGTVRYVHVMSYLFFVGPIPEGFHVDHQCHDPRVCVGGKLCPHRPCFNYRHLAAVTPAENTRRSVSRYRQHCPQGHVYDESNTGTDNRGSRWCRECRSIRNAARKAAQLAAREPRLPKATCANGHLFDEANTYVDPSGDRHCRACKREHMQRARGYRGPVTECPRGHLYDEANTYIVPSTGHKQCRTCNREREATRRASQKEAA